MKKFVLYSVIALVSMLDVFSLSAQDKGERQQWMNEMQQYKRTYFAKELDLTREQQNKFFPLYEEMEAQIRRIDEDTRVMERRVSEAGDDAANIEYEKATEAMYDAKVKEASLEKDYMARFREILSPRQLFQLKAVERRFSREMMRQHHRIRSIRNAETKWRENNICIQNTNNMGFRAIKGRHFPDIALFLFIRKSRHRWNRGQVLFVNTIIWLSV